jgi:hypothetical protein
MSSPALPDPPGSVWTRFSLDPRSSGDLRAGDSDRDTAREILTEAYAEGRIDRDEYDQRIDSALQAQYLGQLVPILNDISIVPLGRSTQQPHSPVQPQAPARPADRSSGKGRSGAVKTAVFVVGVTNLVWLWGSITNGRLMYYWPMWPALGMAIMLLATFVFPSDREEDGSDRDGRRLDRRRERHREIE